MGDQELIPARLDLGDGVAVGVDWSGAADARRKVWAARLRCRGDRAVLERVERPFASATLREIVRGLARWLERARADVVGLDFCFGLARQQMERLSLPRAGPAELGAELRTRFDGVETFCLRAGPERKRATDALRASPFAPTNLRMVKQTYWGICALARLELPVAPWARGDAAVVEILPAHVARALGAAGKATQAQRRTALERLGAAGVVVPPPAQEAIVADRDGDALDAVLASVAAAAARASGYAGAPAAAAASGEGWIYSVR